MNTGIQWTRVALAGFLSEVAVVVILSSVILTDRFLITPGRTEPELKDFAQNAGYYLAAPAAALATFALSFWATRKLDADFLSNGLVVGMIATLLAVGLIFSARAEDRKMYIVSFVARIVSGYLGGSVAQRIKG